LRSNLEGKNANYNTRKTEGICRTVQPVAQIQFDVADRMMLYSLDYSSLVIVFNGIHALTSWGFGSFHP